MKLIDVFMFDEIAIKELSYRLFNADWESKSLIAHDNIKIGLKDYMYLYKTAQFYHFRDQKLILEKS